MITLPQRCLCTAEELARWPEGEIGKLFHIFMHEQHALLNFRRACRRHCPRAGSNIWLTQGKGRRRVFYWFRQAAKWQMRGLVIMERNTPPPEGGWAF